MPTPFFSIILPSRDRAFLLQPLIDSILDQDFKDFELVIADNSETERVQDMLVQFQDMRIKNIRTGGLNMADNWDQSIALASGKYMLLFSDKMLLKKGALSFLNNFLDKNSIDCVTWDLDILCDKEKRYFQNSLPTKVSKVSSRKLMKSILSSDHLSFEMAPFHCNSCISVKLLHKIRSEHGRVSFQLNPDYTLAYQVVLRLKNIYRLNKSLAILRQKDLETGYGNGFSFMEKTETAGKFMQDNADWALKFGERNEIPIHGNKFIIDIMLKDLYEILKIYDVDPEIYVTLHERIISYYCRTFDEIYWRISMGVNMKHEQACWREALLQEKQCIQKKVQEYCHSMRFQVAKISAINFIKLLPGISYIVLAARNYIKLRKGTKFLSLEELLEQHRV